MHANFWKTRCCRRSRSVKGLRKKRLRSLKMSRRRLNDDSVRKRRDLHKRLLTKRLSKSDWLRKRLTESKTRSAKMLSVLPKKLTRPRKMLRPNFPRSSAGLKKKPIVPKKKKLRSSKRRSATKLRL